MNKIYILGENSFLAKHLYLEIKTQKKYNVILLNHKNYHDVKTANETDIVINFCGVNRANSEDDYEEANHIFLRKIIQNLSSKPFFIHFSSLMVYGFKDKDINDLTNYQKWFIKSKLNGEKYLCENYPEEKLCIIRPSNIYGYDCLPYYNNLLSSLVYEKINGFNKINNINKNCIRNMLSVNNLISEVYKVIENNKYGKYNMISNNDTSLEQIINYIYDNKIPAYLVLNDSELDMLEINNHLIEGTSIVIEENLQNEIKNLEEDMKVFLNLKNKDMLTQSRGNMVEITNLNSKRLYKITLTQHSVRGNHYHHEQTEDFYTNSGKVIYLFAYSYNPRIIYIHLSKENDLISVKPNIIHTLTNDFLNNNPELIISSTQEFIQNIIPDTEYINII
jgi:nucleoside-diphosphate-sugar epimerase